jgi:polyisoprenoid-binding protein YceI
MPIVLTVLVAPEGDKERNLMRNGWQIVVVGLLASFALVACGGEPAPASPPAVAATDTATEAVTEAATEAGAEAGAPALVAGQRTFVIVPEESKASYLVDEEFFGGAFEKYGIAAGEADVVGSTQQIAGQLQLNLDDLGSALGENRFTVQMNTLVTGEDRRDGWIRENGPRFNDYPEATFVATAIESAPASYTDGQEVSFKLIGDLTVRDVTQQVAFDVTASLAGDTLTGAASTRLKMSDFGIEPPNFANTLTVADEFGILVEFVAKG